MDIKQYLSYGAGVGSTALLCYLLDEVKSGDIEVVFCDHGGDWPETYDYVNYIQQKLDINITVLKVDIEKKGGLYDYFHHYKMVPLFQYRICTDKGKIKPFNKYIERPCMNYLGITWDERRRARANRLKTVTNQYPFVEKRITRNAAIKIITNAGLNIPIKSGCWFCPFQGKDQWRKLYNMHDDLFLKAIELENNGNGTRIQPNGKPLQLMYDSFKYQTKLNRFEVPQR